ncbi:MAG: AbrB/MazE/SpoVT family DNA-binding domain-containing protein [Kyrpidia tusciae]|nr:AbrB/MazE/SpoVT family DNA-binding domain-containing protein [Kyrpidia tusciae]MBE3552932.1 AbrB/MazE/SpoVT family DNA-binding domain-containing protein [Kyrpidia tusciae]
MAMAKVTSKFQLTIPNEIRNALGIEGGDRILFQVDDHGHVSIRVVKPASVDDLAGSLGRAANRPIEYVPIDEARQAVCDQLAETNRLAVDRPAPPPR